MLVTGDDSGWYMVYMNNVKTMQGTCLTCSPLQALAHLGDLTGQKPPPLTVSGFSVHLCVELASAVSTAKAYASSSPPVFPLPPSHTLENHAREDPQGPLDQALWWTRQEGTVEDILLWSAQGSVLPLPQRWCESGWWEDGGEEVQRR